MFRPKNVFLGILNLENGSFVNSGNVAYVITTCHHSSQQKCCQFFSLPLPPDDSPALSFTRGDVFDKAENRTFWSFFLLLVFRF